MLSFIFWVLLLCGVEALHTSDFYTAAVLEHVKADDPRDRSSAIRKNLDTFQDAALGAARVGADIIVFPEAGIMPSIQMTRRLLVDYYEAIPDPAKIPPWTPCLTANTTDFPVLSNLSSIARANGIYVVANVGGKEACSPLNDTRCPEDVQTLFYNTDVVFDSNGTLIARHRKRFLFFETDMTRPKEPEYTVFNTSFGSFAVIICFDSVFNEAVEVVEMYHVENMIISTYWFDELPFVSALEYFAGWALGNHVNVLAANIHEPSTGTIGSLMVSRFHGTLAYTFNPTSNNSQLLVTKIPRTSTYNVTVDVPKKISMEGYRHENTDMSNYNLTKLSEPRGSVESCNNGLCCHLDYIANTQPENFYLAAFNGIRNVGNYYFLCQEICTLVLCTNGSNCTSFPTHSEVSFQSVSLNGNISTSYQYPGVMASEMSPVPYAKWNFSPGHLEVHNVTDPLLSVTIHGRCYDRDPPFPETRRRNNINHVLEGVNLDVSELPNEI